MEKTVGLFITSLHSQPMPSFHTFRLSPIVRLKVEREIRSPLLGTERKNASNIVGSPSMLFLLDCHQHVNYISVYVIVLSYSWGSPKRFRSPAARTGYDQTVSVNTTKISVFAARRSYSF